MSDQLTIEELQKAAANLNRIEEFLSVRSEWHLELDGFEALREIDGAAETIIRRVDAILDLIGRRADWTLPAPPEPLPTSKFDSARLVKLAGFMTQLSQWFDIHVGHEVEPGGEDHVTDIHKTLRTIRGGVEPIIEASPFRDSVPQQRPPAADGGEPSALSAAGPAHVPRKLAAQTGVASVHKLVLEDTDEKPITQTFRGEVELADDAKEAVTDFLKKHEVEYSGYRLHKFQDEVLRRVTSTPEGQVLVLKIGGFQDNPNPFFSYVSKIVDDSRAKGPVTIESPYLGVPLPRPEEGTESAPEDSSPAEMDTPPEPESKEPSSPALPDPEAPIEFDEDLFVDNDRTG